MTVAAPSQDTAGAALLTGVAQVQALVTAHATPAIQPALVAQLNALQVQAVDHFMATYWVCAANILAQMNPIVTDKNATMMKARIASVQAQVNATTSLVTGPYYAQLLNQLQSELVDYYMGTGAITAASILATMTGVQTFPFNYVSGYTYYDSWGSE